MEKLYEKYYENIGKMAQFTYDMEIELTRIIGNIEIIVSSSNSKLCFENDQMWKKLEGEISVLCGNNNKKMYEHNEVNVAYELYDCADLNKIIRCCDEQVEIYNEIKTLLEESIEYVRSIEGKQNVHKDILEKIKVSAKKASSIMNNFFEKDLKNINELKEDCEKRLKNSKR